MNENAETIAHVKDANGIPVGRIRVEPDHDGGADMSLDELLGSCGVTIAPVWVGRGVDIEFYRVGHDSKFLGALERFTEEFGPDRIRADDEVVEIFKRYMKIFHPLTPVIDKWIITGYSQGESVRVLAWAEPHENNAWLADETSYQWAARMHEQIEDDFLPMVGAHARGQYITTIYETVMMSNIEIDEDELTAEVTWEQEDCIGGTMYLEEFAPNAVAIETAKDHFGLDGLTIEEV